MKKTFYTELSYLFGIILLALGVAFMEAGDLGMSMIVAPAYLVYRKLSLVWSFFTFGMAEYLFQALLLIVLCAVLRRFRLPYLFSFVTAVFYGFVLDFIMLFTVHLPREEYWQRGVWYVLGMLICSLGVALVFHTYIPPEVYELFVKELAQKLGKPVHKVKTVYDCTSCAVGILLSFAFFGLWHFEGVKLGTILCALINGRMIGAVMSWLDARFEFKDALPLRTFFEKAE